MTQAALANRDASGVMQYRVSTDAAGLCGEIVKKTAQNIQGKKYVRVEGWNAIATAHGCTTSITTVEAVEGGIRAVAQLRRINDGSIIAEAEGFVGDDEPMWAKRLLYARRAMAQTRAISRVCRTAFAHVVVLIDSGLETTPAEEMVPRTMPRPAVATKPTPAAAKPEPAPAPEVAEPEVSEPEAPAQEQQTADELYADCEIAVGIVQAIAKPRSIGKSIKYSLKLDNGNWYETWNNIIGVMFENFRGKGVTIYYKPKTSGKYTNNIIEHIEEMQ